MKKGFTLVELITVIILLGLIGTIAVTSINKILIVSKNSMYERQIENITKLTKEYIVEYGYKEKVYLQDLIDKEIISTDSVIDPRDDSNMLDTNAYVKVTYDDSKEEYTYEFVLNGNGDK